MLTKEQVDEARECIEHEIKLNEEWLTRLIDSHESLRADLTSVQQARDEWKAIANVGTWHSDCRPNRQQAGRELAKSQAVIDKLADRISALELAEWRKLTTYLHIHGINTPLAATERE